MKTGEKELGAATTPARNKILIVDDDVSFRSAVADALAEQFAIETAGTVAETRDRLDRSVSLVLLDVRLRRGQRDRDGIDLLESIKQLYPDLPVVMMTAYADIDLAVEAMRLGAADFIQKANLDIREFRKVLENALERSRLETENETLKQDLRRLEPWELVGDDPKLQDVRTAVDVVAHDGYCTVMLRGDTGTGKELVARAIHDRGPRAGKPFVPVSLAALSPELISTELFGHVKGAFTDAKEARIGYVEKAQSGVLFLDEIGELTLDVQAKLLRFLETRTFARVGSTTSIEVDVQIVCATNRNLEEAIRLRQFREDLFYRLRTMEIRLPPLRERVGDIPLLVDHFVFILRQQGRTKLAAVTPAALQCLRSYPFPGNVRELKSVVERSVMWANNHGHKELEEVDLPAEVRGVEQVPNPSLQAFGERGIDLDQALARAELAYVQEALHVTEGKKTDAWKLLGLNDRFALRRRVKRIGETYPTLMNEYPLVKQLYAEQ